MKKSKKVVNWNQFTVLLVHGGENQYSPEALEVLENAKESIINCILDQDVRGGLVTPRHQGQFKVCTTLSSGAVKQFLSSEKQSGLPLKKRALPKSGLTSKARFATGVSLGQLVDEQREKDKKFLSDFPKVYADCGGVPPIVGKSVVAEEQAEQELNGSLSEDESAAHTSCAADVICVVASSGNYDKVISEIEDLLSSSTKSDRLIDAVVELKSSQQLLSAENLSTLLQNSARRNINLWTDLAFLTLQADNAGGVQLQTADLMYNFGHLVADCAFERALYTNWVNNAEVITFPKNISPGEKEVSTLVDNYHEALRNCPEAAISPAVCLFCMVDAVENAIIDNDDERDALQQGFQQMVENQCGTYTKEEERKRQSGVFETIAFHDTSLLRLKSAINASCADVNDAKIFLDQPNVEEITVGVCVQSPLLMVERYMYSLLYTPGGYPRQGMSPKPILSDITRGTKVTEEMTFMPEHIDRQNVSYIQQISHMSETFQTFLEETYGNDGTMDVENVLSMFLDREYQDKLEPHTLPQVLHEAEEIFDLSDSTTLSEYHPQSDTLLVLQHYPTFPGRRYLRRWDVVEGGCAVKQGFRKWRNILNQKIKDATTQGGKSIHEKDGQRLSMLPPPVFFDSDITGMNAKIVRNDTILYPANRSIMRLNRQGISKMSADVNALPVPRSKWVTASIAEHRIGLRYYKPSNPMRKKCASYFVASLKDGSQGKLAFLYFIGYIFAHPYTLTLYIVTVCAGPSARKKPDGFGTINMINTCASGLVVETLSNGDIRQSFPEVPQGVPPSIAACVAEEEYRTIAEHGTVYRVLRDGSREILLSNGDVYRITNDSQFWVITKADGEQEYGPNRNFERKGGHSKKESRTKKKLTSKAFYSKDIADYDELPQLKCTVQQDPVTMAKVTVREDGMKMIQYANGDTLTEHHDGTMQYCYRKDKVKYVSVRRPGFASIEIDEEVNSTAIRHAAGGRIAITKGGEAIRSKIWLPPIGRGGVVKINYDTRITSRINGHVHLYKPEDDLNITAYDDSNVEFDETSYENNKELIGVFRSDIKRGCMTLVDNEQNTFRIGLDDDGTGMDEIEIDLAGDEDDIVAPPVINAPIEPRLWLLNGGYGFELLRNADVKAFRRLGECAKFRWETSEDNAENFNTLVKSIKHNRVVKSLSQVWCDNPYSIDAMTCYIRSIHGDDFELGEEEVPEKKEGDEENEDDEEKETTSSRNATTKNTVRIAVDLDEASPYHNQDLPRLLPALSKLFNGPSAPLPFVYRNQQECIRYIDHSPKLNEEDMHSLREGEKKFSSWTASRENEQGRFDVNDDRDTELIEREVGIGTRILQQREEHRLMVDTSHKVPESISSRSPTRSERSSKKGRRRTTRRVTKLQMSSSPKRRLPRTNEGPSIAEVKEHEEGVIEEEKESDAKQETKEEAEGQLEAFKEEPEKSTEEEKSEEPKEGGPPPTTDGGAGSFWRSDQGAFASELLTEEGSATLEEKELGEEKEMREVEQKAVAVGSARDAIRLRRKNRNEEEKSDQKRVAPISENVAPQPKITTLKEGVNTSAFVLTASTAADSSTLRHKRLGLSRERRNSAITDSITNRAFLNSRDDNDEMMFHLHGPTLLPIQIEPSIVDFGDISAIPGQKYFQNLVIHNIGNQSARFRVTRGNNKVETQPDAKHSLQVQYRVGPIAPGLQTKLSIQLIIHSIEINEDIRDVIEVITEYQVFKVPVRARIK
eukprot:g872.t1